MVLHVGIDETMFDLEDKEGIRYIFVASYSNQQEQGRIRKYSKRRRKSINEGKQSAYFEGLAGFVLRTFVFEPKYQNGTILREKQLRSISSLVGEIINLTNEIGMLDDENISITIDGKDSNNLKREIINYLRDRGYDGSRSQVKFIIKGDKKVGVVNTSDTLAYLLRHVSWQDPDEEILTPESLDEERVRKIFEEDHPWVKDVAPYFRHPKPKKDVEHEHKPLEKIVS